MNELIAVLSYIHASQTNSTRGLGDLKLVRGLMMYLDRKRQGADRCRSLNGARYSPRVCSNNCSVQSISPDDTRKAPDEGNVPIVGFLCDNADFHRYAKVVSMIVAGTILIGYESKANNDLMNDFVYLDFQFQMKPVRNIRRPLNKLMILLTQD